jgi:hypothetical protein
MNADPDPQHWTVKGSSDGTVPGMGMALTGSEGGDGRLGGGAGSDIRRSLHIHRLVDVLVHLP